jgi:hypothetical protein
MITVEIQNYLWNNIQMCASSLLPHYDGSAFYNELHTNFMPSNDGSNNVRYSLIINF